MIQDTGVNYSVGESDMTVVGGSYLILSFGDIDQNQKIETVQIN